MQCLRSGTKRNSSRNGNKVCVRGVWWYCEREVTEKVMKRGTKSVKQTETKGALHIRLPFLVKETMRPYFPRHGKIPRDSSSVRAASLIDCPWTCNKTSTGR